MSYLVRHCCSHKASPSLCSLMLCSDQCFLRMLAEPVSGARRHKLLKTIILRLPS